MPTPQEMGNRRVALGISADLVADKMCIETFDLLDWEQGKQLRRIEGTPWRQAYDKDVRALSARQVDELERLYEAYLGRHLRREAAKGRDWMEINVNGWTRADIKRVWHEEGL